MNTRDELLRVYALASGGNPEAYAFLIAWHLWCHRIDDYVDETGHPVSEVVDLCADGVVLCSSGFYRRHAECLGPVMGAVAAKYKQSLQARGRLQDVLRLAGNDLVLVVAYLCGGRTLVQTVGDSLWPIVEATQLTGS